MAAQVQINQDLPGIPVLDVERRNARGQSNREFDLRAKWVSGVAGWEPGILEDQRRQGISTIRAKRSDKKAIGPWRALAGCSRGRGRVTTALPPKIDVQAGQARTSTQGDGNRQRPRFIRAAAGIALPVADTHPAVQASPLFCIIATWNIATARTRGDHRADQPPLQTNGSRVSSTSPKLHDSQN